RTASLFVALHAPAAIIIGLGGSGWQAMGVVARDATQFALTGAEAPTRLHLFDLTDQFRPIRIRLLADENSQRSLQREARAEVKGIAPPPGETKPSLKMALLTHRLP